jgi:hypothetical protein
MLVLAVVWAGCHGDFALFPVGMEAVADMHPDAESSVEE